MSEDFFALLDAEVANAVKTADDLRKVEKLRKLSNNTKLPHPQRAAIKEEYKLLLSVYEANLWHVTAIGALFSEQLCDGCGSKHRTFLQYMEHQEYHNNKASTRWVRVSKPRGDYPREVLIQPIRTHVCADCAADHGFQNETYLRPTSTVTVSTTYIQEDINAPSEEDRYVSVTAPESPGIYFDESSTGTVLGD